jgi:tetratricopeptide (TPR) repeat protein
MRINILLKSFLLGLILSSLFACTSNAPTPVQNSKEAAQNSNTSAPVAVSHGGQNTNEQSKSTGGMRGGGTPIDTSKYDADIKKAEEKYNKNQNDNAAKMALAKAYLARANALTLEGRQYRSAIGDYRRVLKYDPDNQEAKDWINQIVAIFQDMNREVPKEGEEPPPLPYGKK